MTHVWFLLLMFCPANGESAVGCSTVVMPRPYYSIELCWDDAAHAKSNDLWVQKGMAKCFRQSVTKGR